MPKPYLLVCILCEFIRVTALCPNAISAEYLLGPQDRLLIRVYDLRRNAGEAYSWTALNGEFTVGSDGTISLPLIGFLKAGGSSAADLSKAIGSTLKSIAGLAETPSASVEIQKYRSFYVLGAVQQPGKYEYQPGLSVLQAVSTAQGFRRSPDTYPLRKELITSGGELQGLESEKIALTAKLDRLNAETSESTKVNFDNLLKSASDQQSVAKIINGEKMLFESRRNAVRDEIATIQQAAGSYRQEIASLDAKSKTLDRQVEIGRRELEVVSDLVSKGLAVSPRKIAAEQTQVTFESSRLDVQIAVLRAQQSLTRAERDVIEIQSKFRREALTEEAEIRLKLEQTNSKIRTSRLVSKEAEEELFSTAAEHATVMSPTYEIVRIGDPENYPRKSQAFDLIEPGDVLQVNLTPKTTQRSDLSSPNPSTTP